MSRSHGLSAALALGLALLVPPCMAQPEVSARARVIAILNLCLGTLANDEVFVTLPGTERARALRETVVLLVTAEEGALGAEVVTSVTELLEDFPFDTRMDTGTMADALLAHAASAGLRGEFDAAMQSVFESFPHGHLEAGALQLQPDGSLSHVGEARRISTRRDSGPPEVSGDRSRRAAGPESGRQGRGGAGEERRDPLADRFRHDTDEYLHAYALPFAYQALHGEGDPIPHRDGLDTLRKKLLRNATNDPSLQRPGSPF